MSDERFPTPQFTPLEPYPDGAPQRADEDEAHVPFSAKVSKPVRIALAGAAGAVVLGAIFGLGMPKSFRGAPDTEIHPAAPVPATAVAQFDFRPIGGGYQAPDQNQVAQAYRDTQGVIAKEGVSGAARTSIDCYQRLARQPSYGLMDYCLAMDVFGAQAYARAAGDAAPPSTYFGQGAVRRQQAVQILTGGQTDTNSRLLDTSRLVAQVAQAELQRAAAPQPVPTPAPAVAEPPARPAPAIPPPSPQPKVTPAPTPAPAPPPAQIAKLAPKAAPVPPPQRIRPEPPPPQRARAAAETPSYDCRRARSRGERMVCEEPALAAADRRLANAFQRALDQSPDPRRLIADQNRWLALRDDLAPDYDAVMGLYQDRILELRRQRDF